MSNNTNNNVNNNANNIQGLWFTDNAFVSLIDMKIYYSSGEIKDIIGPVTSKLIQEFYNNPHKLLTYETLENSVWGGYAIYSEINTAISRLRGLVKDPNKIFIKNIQGNGYILDAPNISDIPKVIINNLNAVHGINININNNAYIATKKEIESLGGELSLEERSNGAKHIIQVSYAGTSFLASRRISDIYASSWKQHFIDLLKDRRIDLVLVSPEAGQLSEMINYKLRPRTSNGDVDRTNPFQYNFTFLMTIMDLIKGEYITNADFNVYFADFSLSNSYFQCIFPDEAANKETIKVDMYIPLFSKYIINNNNMHSIPSDQWADDDRPSFIVSRKEQPKLYSHLAQNVKDILANSEQVIKGGAFINDWEKKFTDYSNGSFDRPFDKNEILDDLL